MLTCRLKRIILTHCQVTIGLALVGISLSYGSASATAKHVPIGHKTRHIGPDASLIGTYIDATAHPGQGRLTLNADHTFFMYKGSAYMRLTPSGLHKLPRIVRGTWKGYKEAIELLNTGPHIDIGGGMMLIG